MAKWTMTRDVAQHIVDIGEKKRNSMTQTVSSYPFEREEQVSLMTVASDWEKVDGIYSAQAYIKGFSENQDSGAYTVYAPTSSEDSPPPIKKGAKMHVANIAGRLECIGGAGSGSSMKIGYALITWYWTAVNNTVHTASATVYDSNGKLIGNVTIYAFGDYGYGKLNSIETRLCVYDGSKWVLFQTVPKPEEIYETTVKFTSGVEVSNGSIYFKETSMKILTRNNP